MKRKYRQAMRAKADRPWDTYIDGVEDDALETLHWHEDFTPSYEASQPSQQETEEMPF